MLISGSSTLCNRLLRNSKDLPNFLAGKMLKIEQFDYQLFTSRKLIDCIMEMSYQLFLAESFNKGIFLRNEFMKILIGTFLTADQCAERRL